MNDLIKRLEERIEETKKTISGTYCQSVWRQTVLQNQLVLMECELQRLKGEEKNEKEAM